MPQHMISSNLEFSFADKRRAQGTNREDSTSHLTTGPTVFTANAGGSTTTIVGANATPATSTNVVRIGDKFRLFGNGTTTVKEEKVFKVTGVAVAASTTVTFTPAAATATVSGDYIRLATANDLTDMEALDARLTAINPTSYTASRLSLMTPNDKMYAIRLADDPSSI